MPRAEFRTRPRLTNQGTVVTQPISETALDDAAFLVGIGGHATLLEECAAALAAPRWPLYLGRREFPPTAPLSLGVVDGNPLEVVCAHDWIASPWYQAKQHDAWLEVTELTDRPRAISDLPPDRWVYLCIPRLAPLPTPALGHHADGRIDRLGRVDWFGEVAAQASGAT